VSIRSLRFVLVVSLSTLFASLSWGQTSNVTNTTATPIPGAGHDYIKMLTETVNPANGQASVRIGTPNPPARGVNLPFAFVYNSAGVHHLESFINNSAAWYTDTGQATASGWSYSLPTLTAYHGQVTVFNPNANPPTTYSCDYVTGYILRDSSVAQAAITATWSQVLLKTCWSPALETLIKQAHRCPVQDAQLPFRLQ
jgi:hypothetical protein